MSDPRTFWNARYAEPGFAYGSSPNDFVREVAEVLPPGPVLCLAEGEGRNAVFLAERGHAVTAMDLSEVGLAKARALAAERGVTITTEVADLGAYTIAEGKWSAIVCVWMHLPQPLRAQVLAAVARGLTPGGALVLESYTPAQLAHGTGGPREISMLADPEDLRRELAGLSFERFDVKEREIHEGPHHDGLSSVVQVLARRPS